MDRDSIKLEIKESKRMGIHLRKQSSHSQTWTNYAIGIINLGLTSLITWDKNKISLGCIVQIFFFSAMFSFSKCVVVQLQLPRLFPIAHPTLSPHLPPPVPPLSRPMSPPSIHVPLPPWFPDKKKYANLWRHQFFIYLLKKVAVYQMCICEMLNQRQNGSCSIR